MVKSAAHARLFEYEELLDDWFSWVIEKAVIADLQFLAEYKRFMHNLTNWANHL